MIRIQHGGIVFSAEVFRRKDEYLLLYNHSLTGKKKSSNSSVGLKKLDDKWSLNSANFCRCRSCDFIDLNTATGKQSPGVIGSADKK